MKKILSFAIVTATVLAIVFTAFNIPSVRHTIAKRLPVGLKQTLKDTLFVLPSLREEIAANNIKVHELEAALDQTQLSAKETERQRNFVNLSGKHTLAWQTLSLVYGQSKNELLLRRAPPRAITSSGGEEYLLELYELPFLPTRLEFGLKPLFYLDSTSTDFYVVTGDGVFFKGAKAEVGNEFLAVETLPNNLRQVINDEAIFAPGWFSIKDLKIHNGRVYISYTKKIENNYTLAILVADVSPERLDFKEFFAISDTASTAGHFNAHQSGGRIVAYKDNKLLISTGDFRQWSSAQDPSSLLGKIFSIELDSKQTEIVSLGHRNVQGLHYDPDSGAIMSTEHGPVGGDEINLNFSGGNQKVNFGWPISSYGVHYDGQFHEEAPLYKSHTKHGFKEPLAHFSPSGGISQIIKLPNSFARGFANDYFTSTMGMNPKAVIYSLRHFRMDKQYKKVLQGSIIRIGERIRDMHMLDEKRLLLALEGNNIPAIGILRAN